MGMSVDTGVTLRIILQKPPAGADFGVQKGHGSAYETIQTQRSKGNDLKFEISVAAKISRKGAAPDFGGPFVQGPRGARFLYLDIGTYAGQSNTCWSRRLKIPLIGITWKMISSRKTLVAEVPGTGNDGGPSCAYAWRKSVPSWRWRVATN
jgi:hypothetical protein